MAILNYDKKKLLEQEIKDIDLKFEQFKQEVVQDAKDKGTYKPGENIALSKELKEIYDKLQNGKTKKEEELELLVKEMVSNNDLNDPVDIAKEKLNRVETNNESIELLKEIIDQAKQLGKNINKLSSLGVADTRMLIPSIHDLKALKYNCETRLRGLRYMDRKEIEKEISTAEKARELKLKELEEKETVLNKYRDTI